MSSTVYRFCLAGCAAAFLGPGFGSGEERPAIPLLRQAHAHNDYQHKRPLLDALNHGFGSVEADVHLVKGDLLVGHFFFDLKPERTLEKLYLDPLQKRIEENGGRVYKKGPPLWLLIDVKTEANTTYEALDKGLARYADLLTVIKDGKAQEKAITVVVSGNRATEAIKRQNPRFVGIDGRIADLDSAEPAHLMPWISDRWSAHFRWRGQGDMPVEERARLKEFVRKAHAHGRRLRFWATPEEPAVWRELRTAGVDLISTDKLSELRKFLIEKDGAGRSK